MKEDARRAITPPPREREAHDYEGLPWLITDDYLLLKVPFIYLFVIIS